MRIDISREDVFHALKEVIDNSTVSSATRPRALRTDKNLYICDEYRLAVKMLYPLSVR